MDVFYAAVLMLFSIWYIGRRKHIKNRSAGSTKSLTKMESTSDKAVDLAEAEAAKREAEEERERDAFYEKGHR
jgi:hypothetical protein